MAGKDPDRAAEHVERLVIEYLDRLPEQGDDTLDVLCLENPEYADDLRRQVRALHDMGLVSDQQESFPERLGEFRLLRRIGGGGMGVVFLAEQDPFERRVAVKLIRPDQLFFRDARLRFWREIEVISKLKHPGIVPIYTVGEAEGVPYFAMEWIEGVTLAEVIRHLEGRAVERLTGRDLASFLKQSAPDSPAGAASDPELFHGTWPETCLRIVSQVADALQYAHDRGILHRDVKPSNVMLTASGRVMLLDFGLAQSRATDRLTRTGSEVGSLPYMAPEQVRGERMKLGPPTDLYALGISLYELLTLRLPYLADTTEKLRRHILDGDPPLPRGTNRAMSWETETVCLKAMDQDPGRRYESAQAFAEDIRRTLEKRPIHARRAGLVLRARRYAQRNLAQTLTWLMGLLLLFGSAGFAIQQKRSRDRVQHQRDQFQKALEFVGSLLQAVDPHRASGNSTTARQILDECGQRADDEFSGEPEVYAMLQHTMGGVYLNLGLIEPARERLESALQLRQRHLGPSSTEVVDSLISVGELHQVEQEFEECERRYLEALAVVEEHHPDDRPRHASALMHLGSVIRDQGGRVEEASQILNQALDMQRELHGNDHVDVAGVLHNLARLHVTVEEWAKARDLYQQALAIYRRLDLGHNPDVAHCLTNLGLAERELGDFDRAEELLQEALDMRRSLLDRSHPHISQSLEFLAWTAYRSRDYSRAEPLFQEAWEVSRLTYAPGDPRIGRAQTFYAQCLVDQGRLDEAEPLLLEAHEFMRTGFGERHDKTRDAIKNLHRLYKARGDFQKARQYLRMLDEPASD